MSRRIAIILVIFLIFTIFLMILVFIFGIRIDIGMSIFLIFTFMILFTSAFILKKERIEEIKSIIRMNRNLSISALSEKTQAPEEWIEKLLIKLKSEELIKIHVEDTQKKLKSTMKKLKFFKNSILIIIPIIIIISLINMYITFQKDSNSYEFRFWSIFSLTSLVLLGLGFIISDIAEKGSIIQRIRSFKIKNMNVFKFPGVGYKMISILLVILLYIRLLVPSEDLAYIFMLGSPLFLFFIILGIISVVLIIIGFLLGAKKARREKDSDAHTI